MSSKKVPSTTQMSPEEQLKWCQAHREIANETFSDIYTLASHARTLYDDLLNGNKTTNEFLISALMHGVMALASQADHE